MSAARQLGCPSCGGVLEEAAASGPTRCPYCGLPVLLVLEGVPERTWLRPRVPAETLPACLRSAFQGSAAPAGFPDEEVLREPPRLLFLPLYELVGTSLVRIVDGEDRQRLLSKGDPFWKHVFEQDRRADGKYLDSRVVIRDLTHVEPALLRRDVGLESLDAAQLADTHPERRPFLLEELVAEGVPFEPEYSAGKLRQLMEHSVRGEPGEKGVRAELLECTVSVLYYPVWEVPLGRRGAGRSAFVDGRTGRVLTARSDEDPEARNLLAQLLLMGLGATLATIAHLVVKLLQPRDRSGLEGSVEVADQLIEGLVRGTGVAFLAVVAGLLLLGLYRRYLHARRVVVQHGTHRLETRMGDGESFLDTPLELLEALVRAPRILLGSLRGGGLRP